LAAEAQLVFIPQEAFHVYTPFTDGVDLVRLRSGALAVFSPVALTDEVKETVAKLGEVKYITALDIEVGKTSYTISLPSSL
jgi:hypothetical protein